MHEWLITRGNVQGAPFEWQMQIYVPWNVVIVHEGKCHLNAQWDERGMLACFKEVTEYYSIGTLSRWLHSISDHITIANEKLRQLETWWRDVSSQSE